MTKSAKIRRLLSKNTKPIEIAKKLKVKPNLVYQVAWHAKKAKKPSKILRAVKQMDRELNAIKGKKYRSLDNKTEWVEFPNLGVPDLVNHPPHYTDGGVDTLTYIEAKDLNYRLGNVVKYVSRAGKKLNSDPVQDLEKAAFYLQREIEARKNA